MLLEQRLLREGDERAYDILPQDFAGGQPDVRKSQDTSLRKQAAHQVLFVCAAETGAGCSGALGRVRRVCRHACLGNQTSVKACMPVLRTRTHARRSETSQRTSMSLSGHAPVEVEFAPASNLGQELRSPFRANSVGAAVHLPEALVHCHPTPRA